MTPMNKTHPLPASDRVGLNPKKEVFEVSHNNIETSAREFAAHSKDSDSRLRLLAARNVGAGNISAAKFAEMAGVSEQIVLHYMSDETIPGGVR